MKKTFITYGDSFFLKAKERICSQANFIGVFDTIIPYGRDDLSLKLMESDVINERRGGGLWSWKPDIILTTIENSQIGDIIVYSDAGCSLYRSLEWNRYFEKLENYDIIAQRIFQRTNQWTRVEILDFFSDNGISWHHQYQFLATVIILKVTKFTKQFITEWRDLMINNPEFSMDVNEKDRLNQLSVFIENRHDQAIYSALIYKYLNKRDTKHLIYTQWEHIEDYDPICKQAIRATRLRHGQPETSIVKFKSAFKRIIKDYLYKPFFYIPTQWWYENLKTLK